MKTTYGKWALVLVVLAGLAATAGWHFNRLNHDGFAVAQLPMDHIDRFFDVGVVDADGDGNQDIYTSNHHFRQLLLLGDGHGHYRDVLSQWGLDQNAKFPNAELSFSKPETDRPGLYLYWIGTQFVIQLKGGGTRPLEVKGSLDVNDPIRVLKKQGFTVHPASRKLNERVTHTHLEFAAKGEGYLRLKPGGQGLPIHFRIGGNLQPQEVFVGLGKVSPQQLDFSLWVRDRHALVWADYNSDGRKDVFIDRGALGGTLRAQPDDIRRFIQDELLVRQPDGHFRDLAWEAGLRKRDCSGRHAHWLDFNGDGRLDLFVNCFDRKHVQGQYPKQLYLQQPDGTFRDAAAQAGAALPEQQMGSLVWFDADADGDPDLATLENEGLFLYRNQNGTLHRETVFKRPLQGVQIGSSTEGAWVYDGKISLADLDLDGDLDLFSASKRGNVVLINDAGHLRPAQPEALGLPQRSLNAVWLDYDNDGHPDLLTVPQGLYRNHGGRFEAIGRFVYPEAQYVGAVSNAFDMDNDGRLDLLLALDANPDYDPWWRKVRKPRVPTTWLVQAYRNQVAGGHWLELDLQGLPGNLDAIGTRVAVTTAAGTRLQEVGASEGAFFSQGHYRLHFGLGDAPTAQRIEITWPDGTRQVLEQVQADRILRLRHPGAG